MTSILMIALALNGGLYLGTILHSALKTSGTEDRHEQRRAVF